MMVGVADIAGQIGRCAETAYTCIGAGIQVDRAERSQPMEETVKVGLDVVPLSYPPSGVRAYVQALIDAFRSRDSGIEVAPLAPLSGLTRSSSRFSRLSWDVRGIAGSAGTARVDLLHMTRFAAPRAIDRPFVVTVHDLISLQLTEYRASLPSRIQSELARRTVRSANRIIVPSRFVADEVSATLEIPDERIDVIPMGVELPSDVQNDPPIAGPYIVHAGGFDARKNLAELIRAFSIAAKQIGDDWRLVLLGAPHTGNTIVYPPLGPVIERSGLSDRIVLAGRVSEAEKHAWYRHADIAVAPSLSEGFGLPILEAMAHGIPVLASNRTSHPEVAGEAALLVEPSAEELAAGLIRLAAGGELRADLAMRGRGRAALFPWSRTARLTAESYRKALDA